MESKHGAGVICSGKMTEIGFNYDNRTKVGGMALPSVHSEMDVILKLLRKRNIYLSNIGGDIEYYQKWVLRE